MALLRFITLIVIIQIFTTVSIVSSFSTINLKKRYTTLLHVSLNKPSLELCDENIAIVMDEIKSELGTLFGYDAGNFYLINIQFITNIHFHSMFMIL